MSQPTPRKRRRTTVGSILIPDLPWKPSPTPPTGEGEGCPSCGHDNHSADEVCNQVDCDCVDPWHCI